MYQEQYYVFKGQGQGDTAIIANGKSNTSIFIDDNIVNGWKCMVNSPNASGNPLLMLTGNRSDGKVNIGSGWRKIIKDNIKF